MLKIIKKYKIYLLIILVLLSIAIIYFLSKDTVCSFQTKETHFTVRVPHGWSVIKQPREIPQEGNELIPEEGVTLLLNGDDKNCIWIYSQYSSRNIGSETQYTQEAFLTDSGLKGVLYKENGNNTHWELILERNSKMLSFYGASVNISDENLMVEKAQQITRILKSIDIKK